MSAPSAAGPSSHPADVQTILDADAQILSDAEFALRLALREQGLEQHATAVTSVSAASFTPTPHQHTCPICLDPVPPHLSVHLRPCSHVFCKPCIRQYLTTVATETKQYPIPCPSCSSPVDAQLCLALLIDSQAAFHALQTLSLEKQHLSHIRYCSNAHCATPFEWIDVAEQPDIPDKYKVICPVCQQQTCVQCNVPWHHNQTCAEFKATKESDEMLEQLARRQEWRSCPRCRHMIERRKGTCLFVRCRCGCGFCHGCGTEYVSLVGVAGNPHGTPGCACRLFGGDFYQRGVRRRNR